MRSQAGTRETIISWHDTAVPAPRGCHHQGTLLLLLRRGWTWAVLCRDCWAVMKVWREEGE